MASNCHSCKQSLEKKSLIGQRCASCEQTFCSKCLYQRIAVPKLNYQMSEVCSSCFHQISTQMMLSKPPKNFMQRLEKEQTISTTKQFVHVLDPETKALEERLKQLRADFPSASSATMKTTDELIQEMNNQLYLEKAQDESLAARLRILHETMPGATSNTVVLPTAINSEVEDEEETDEEFPWCTVCNENATKRCLDCNELFCESCVKKTHRQSSYKKHQLESYKPSTKAKKKYGY
jgi:hypothetical protein